MVLFQRSALAKNYLLANRLFSTSNKRSFAELIRTIERPMKKTTHADQAGTTKFWKYAFFLAALPAVALVKLNIDLYEDHHPPRPEFKEFEYLRKRAKVFENLLLKT